MKAFSLKLKAFFFLHRPLQIVYKWYNYTNCFVIMLRLVKPKGGQLIQYEDGRFRYEC
jgi:hypothetical protein